MKKTLKISNRITLVVSSIFFAILLLEIGLRITNYQKKETPRLIKNTKSLYALHPQRVYSIKEGVKRSENWASDGLGFRLNPFHTEDTLCQRSNITIVAVGDSFTWGGGMVGNTKTYPAILEKMLQNTDENIIVHNAGVSGYGLDQEFLYIRDELIPKCEPDIIIWNMNPNDIWDSNNQCLFQEKNGSFRQISARHNTLYQENWLKSKIPHFLLQHLNLIDVLLRLPKAIAGTNAFTFGCTIPPTSKEKIRQQTSSKIAFFLNELDNISQEKEILLLPTIVPIHFYFDDTKKNDNQALVHYQILKHSITSAALAITNEGYFNPLFLDANQAIISLIDSGLLNNKSRSDHLALSTKDSQVLGISSKNLAKELFEDDGFHYKHPNELGNQLFAEVVANELKLLLPALLPENHAKTLK